MDQCQRSREMTIHPLHPHGHPLTWQERLDQALTEDEVVSVAREYLATVTPQEVARMPVAVRPGKLVDANDVTTYAFDLVRAECDDAMGTSALQRLAHIMSRASIRLSEIMVVEHHRPEVSNDGDEQRSA